MTGKLTKPLSKELWNKYFAVDHQKKDQTWRVKISSPLLGGATEAKLIQKFKGEEDGWVQLASVIAGGPMDGKQQKSQLKVTEKGLITRTDGKETITIPFPLAVGQSWEKNDKTVTFQGFEDYETPTQTIPKCIVLKTKTKSGTTTIWYSADHGYFFADQTQKTSTSTFILDSIK
ncbi:hypothetical protein N9Z02_01530 [Akkermansiaceae bacterium]|nr:hypothetical protein [Akkermansiaceae bacterium]